MKLLRISSLILAVTCFALFAAAQNNAAKQDAQKAGEHWLSMIDNGSYAGSYDSAASLFKGAITKEKWVSSLDGVRTPLGTLLSRELGTATYATSLPGAPDGEYVVIRFNSSFKFKKQAVETLTMTRDKDGQWRAAGYFIR